MFISIWSKNTWNFKKNDEKLIHYKKNCYHKKITNVYIDITNYENLKKKITEFNPEIIIHLAAQALVSESYKNPFKTIETNVMGTLNIIEVSKKIKNLKSLLIITSDKCYLNKEIKKGYKENDQLGGDDPYSASKASAEIIFNTYAKSFFNNQNKFGYATARAGNVIGGGDWSKDRLIPDCIKSIIKKEINDTKSYFNQTMATCFRAYIRLFIIGKISLRKKAQILG